MFGKTLQSRLLIPVSAFVLALILGGALIFSLVERTRIEAEVAANAEAQSDSVFKILDVTDALVMQQVEGAMRMLIERGKQLGTPAVGGEAQIKDKLVPTLLLGGKSQLGAYELVDGVTRLVGGTATLFVKSGEEFVRVSTNVISNNTRAIGTVLDPNGKAIMAIRQGKGYYGVVDILNEPYLTAYEPMRDAQGTIIGVWYVGYKVDMQALKDVIAKSRLLQSGFVAVLDAKGQARFHPAHVTAERVQALARDGLPGWAVAQQSFERWGFRVVTAYPHAEVETMTRGRAIAIIVIGVFGSAVMIMIIAALLRRLVLRPLGGEPDYASDRMHRIANGDLSVEIQTHSNDDSSLMASLKVMQLKLKNISSSIQENAEALNEQIGTFDKTAQAYAQTRSEVEFADLLRSTKKITRTVDVLGKSIARFKL